MAGFQRATAAGSLCEEAMWGVALELELGLLPRGSSSSCSGVDGGDEKGVELDLQEDVYGPFSGQVHTWWSGLMSAEGMRAGRFTWAGCRQRPAGILVWPRFLVLCAAAVGGVARVRHMLCALASRPKVGRVPALGLLALTSVALYHMDRVGGSGFTRKP